MGDFKKKEAIEFLGISEKQFENYFKYSEEITGYKEKNKWYFKKEELKKWKNTKKNRTIELSLEDYERCFEFAIRMVYGGMSLNGIRGQRSEVQAVDDVILGILAEYAVKKFIKENFKVEIGLDEEVHTEKITPQDFVTVKKKGKKEKAPKIGVGVKASKIKSGFLVLGENEVEMKERKSDAYIFARVDLPTDHLFRILRDHSFFKNAKDCLDKDNKSRKIEELENVPVWICGITYLKELEKVKEIPGQKFDGNRYVKSVGKMHNSDADWKSFIDML